MRVAAISYLIHAYRAVHDSIDFNLEGHFLNEGQFEEIVDEFLGMCN